MPGKYIKRILQARVYDIAKQTPLDEAPILSRRLKNQVLLKREDLQPVYSFKLRGAYNKLANLSENQKQGGVITASAGNHAQGLAMSAERLGIKAVIVMPKTTPDIKVSAVKALKGQVVLRGDTFAEACDHAYELAETKGYCFIHPYDDPDVIAGQGTIGMEILRQHSGPLHAVFVPVGGGGLIAGISCYVKYLRPEVKVIGVEADDSCCLKAALDAGRRVKLSHVGLFADGVAVAQIGKETFRIARQCVDEVITVSTDEICAAVKDVFDDTRSIAEPSGALAIAGLKKYVEVSGIEGETLLAINSGANVNFDRLRYIAERSELGEHREAIFGVTIPERPGSFKAFCKLLGRRSITEFNYRYSGADAAHVFVGIKTSLVEEVENIQAEMESNGYQVQNLSDDEMAKLHIRYMVGGRGPGMSNEDPGVPNEVLYRFEFPERPGALLEFLAKLGARWNISLFHYRNHGDAFGRVLVGMQVEKKDRTVLRGYFDDLNYCYWDETDNQAYRLFLR